MSRANNNPGVKCQRKRPACGHELREHAKDRCFGVTFVNGVAGDCHCTGHIEPLDPAKFPRAGENVEE